MREVFCFTTFRNSKRDILSLMSHVLMFCVLLILFLPALCVLRTMQMEHTKDQLLFSGGTVPRPAPEGLYQGSVTGARVSWKGKKFVSATATGINVFAGESGEVEKYPFKTSYEKGLRDSDLDVLAIDYNLPENPWWLRPVIDEIVAVAPDEYLGKLHIRLIPGYPFTLAYFRLKK